MHRFILSVFIIGMLSASVIAQTTPGSVDGTIGKQDKSLSGSEERTESRRPEKSRSDQFTNRRPDAKESLPSTIRLTEHSIGTYSVTLERASGNPYKGTWGHGYATTFTVTSFAKNSLIMTRRDNPVFGSVWGAYTGQRGTTAPAARRQSRTASNAHGTPRGPN